MTLIREPTWITKTFRRIEPAHESTAISPMKGLASFLEKKKDRAFHRDVTIRKGDLCTSDEELSAVPGVVRGPVDRSFQHDSIRSIKGRDIPPGILGVEIRLDGKDSKKEEDPEGDPRSPAISLQDHQADPEGQQDQKNDPALPRDGRAEMTDDQTRHIGQEDGDERKTKLLIHRSLLQMRLLRDHGSR